MVAGTDLRLYGYGTRGTDQPSPARESVFAFTPSHQRTGIDTGYSAMLVTSAGMRFAGAGTSFRLYRFHN